MKELLKRDLNKTYLILCSGEKQYQESYETEMLMQNQLDTILPLQVLRVNAEIQLLYDITSKQSLKDCTERVKLSMATLHKLFLSIDEVTREMKKYLLDMENIVLDLEHIYCKEDRFYFCYCPWEKQDILVSFRKMLEEILGNLDYRDTAGVELAYHLYQSVCRGEFVISEILREHFPEKERMTEPESTAVSTAELEQEKIPDPVIREDDLKHPEKKEKKGFLRWLVKFFLKKETEEAENEKTYKTEKIVLESSVYGGEEADDRTRILNSVEGNTILLDQMPTGQWKLLPLLPGYEEFCIRGDSFLVGKKKGAVDGYIGRSSISRIHSRFYVRENRLFAADANSTNGTFVNSVPLAPGKEVEIFPGDRILFADVGYECYNNL